MSDKAKLVILEGADASGKSAIYQAFRRATAYQVLIIDRYIGSQIVYDKLYDREDKSAYWYRQEQALSGVYDIHLIVLTAPTETLQARIEEKEKGKDLKVSLANFREADVLFREYFKKSGFEKKVLLDTSRPIDECVNAILAFIDEEPREDTGRKKLEMS